MSSDPVRRTPIDTVALNNPQLSDVLTTWDTDLLTTVWTGHTTVSDAVAGVVPAPDLADGNLADDVVIQVDWIDAEHRPQTSIARTSTADGRWTLMPFTACLVGEGARASLKLTRLLNGEEVRKLGDESDALAYLDSFALQGSYRHRTKLHADFGVDIIAKIAASPGMSDVLKRVVANAHEVLAEAMAHALDQAAAEPGLKIKVGSAHDNEEPASAEVPDELTGGAADVIAAVEWLQTTLGVPQRDILKAANIKERTWHHWQKTPAAHPRLSSQGELWSLMQQVQILLEELDEPAASWFRRNTGRRKLLQKGKFEELVDSVLEEKVRSYAFDDPITARRRRARAAGPEYYLDDEPPGAGDEPGGERG